MTYWYGSSFWNFRDVDVFVGEMFVDEKSNIPAIRYNEPPVMIKVTNNLREKIGCNQTLDNKYSIGSLNIIP